MEELEPFKADLYAANEITTMTCTDNYVVPWATVADDKVGDIKCVDDGASNLSWAPAPDENVAGFTGTINGCVGRLFFVYHLYCCSFVVSVGGLFRHLIYTR